MANIFQTVFDGASSKVMKPNRSKSPAYSPAINGNENNASNSLNRSTPICAQTPVKDPRPMKLPNKVPRVPATPQSATTKKMNSSTSIPENPEADVRVYLRIRPLLGNEKQADFNVEDNIVYVRPTPSARSQTSKHYAERTYQFTDIFNEESTQRDIFDKVAMPLLLRFMRGTDALLFAYGATSAGKTHTVQGSPDEPGLIPRMVRTLLATPAPKGCERGLLISCVEIYNEKIMDLFGDTSKPLRLGRDGFGFTTVKNVIETEVKSAEELNVILKNIENARRQCSTQYNQSSSRSHCIFMIKHVTIPLNPATGKRTNDLSQIKCTRLSIVDLAGSERVSTTEKNPQLDKEAGNINKSMLVLGRCIREIRKVNKGGQSQIPFRESKLTELFRDFFESSNRQTIISIIVNISPSTAQFDDTSFSLQFAAEAIQCNVRNIDEDDDNTIKSIDFENDDEDDENTNQVDSRIFAALEAKIRQEISEEMVGRLHKIQVDYKNEVDQMRTHSAQPYTAKLQQALAQRMQRENASRELEECKRELERERQKRQELQQMLDQMKEQVEIYKQKYEEAKSKKEALEGSVQKMIEATKNLHQRHVDLQADLTNQANEMERKYKEKCAKLEEEIRRLKMK